MLHECFGRILKIQGVDDTMINGLMSCWGMRLRLLFKVFLLPKYIKMMFFFNFLKIIFQISTSKLFKTYKKFNF